MRKATEILTKIFITIMLILNLIVTADIVHAADLTSTLDYITDVKLTQRDGSDFPANIAKDAELRLTYEFSIPNTADVHPGDTFSLPIPDEILITPGPSFDLIDNRNGGSIATVSYVAGGLELTFTDHAENYSDISGNFYMDLAFDENEIGNNEPTIITFEVGGGTVSTQIAIDFDQPPAPVTSVQKSGSYNANTKEITWTITVNEEAVEVLDGILEDSIPAGQIFVPGSVTIGGSPADIADYSYVDPLFTYTFPTSFSTEEVITFRTLVAESEFLFTDSHGVTITEDNSAVLKHNGTTTPSNTASVNIPISFIDKTGTYSSARKQIDWTITVNEIGVTIPDAVVTDTLVSGLTLDTSSLIIDGVPTAVPSAGVTYIGSLITIDLGAVNDSQTITFSTDVDSAVYDQNNTTNYSNTASLAGTNVPSNASDGSGPIGLTSSVIAKSGAGYDPETAEITWRLLVNSNLISIDNPVVTDLIPEGQEYVVGSATISGGAPGSFSFDPTDPDATHTGTLTYTFGATITNSYTIEYRTTVTDPAVYATNRSNVRYYNEASIIGDNIPQSNNTASQRVDSEVIQKSNQGYNYETREIDWRIQVNQNEMDLSSVVISDIIAAGQEYVDGSFNISAGPQTGVFSNVDPTWTYTFDGPITEEYIITFKTIVTDLTVFNTNGNVSFSNSATLTSNLAPGGVVSSDTQNVNNTMIGKAGDYTTGNTFIDWVITINTNDIPLLDGAITDQLQEGLALDTDSVELFHATVNHSNGNLIKGAQVLPLTSANVIYNVDTRLFEFNIPAPIAGRYLLEFRTDITDKTQSPFTNEASFNGSGVANVGNDNPITVAWSGSGSSGTGSFGSMEVFKVDRENNSTFLEGAEFELEDKYGNIVRRVTTDASGSALFERLRFDVNYIVREVTAPTGYILSSEDYLFQISSALIDKDLSYLYENDRIYGNIEFTKNDENSDPLANAVFTLYDSDGDVITTATSGSDGVVSFTNVAYGTYTIRETTAPEGYLLSSDVLNASILIDGATIDATPSSITNDVITGDIQITKVDEDSLDPLSGASFSLYSDIDTSFSTPLDTQVSDVNGVLLFENVKYGDYVIRETIAPTGYQLSTNTVNVSVITHGVTVDAGNYTNPKIIANIEVLKRNVRHEPLEGATFTLYNDLGTAVAQSTSGSNGVAMFYNVPYGNYTVKETTAPHMYLLSDAIMVADITSGDIINVISTNERRSDYPWPEESPDTGDDVIMYLTYSILCIILLISILLLDNYFKKKIKSKLKK